MSAGRILRNAEPLELREIPLLAMEAFREQVVQDVEKGARIASLCVLPLSTGKPRLTAVLAWDANGELSVLSAEVEGAYPALTPDCEQAHWFEREIAEIWGVQPEGHPWLKPIRFQPCLRADGSPDPSRAAPPCGVTDFFALTGDEIHEVAVGPVHAGIIEPGHFRFQCHGEIVHHLEISLGYQHRGVERALRGGPDKRSIHYLETLAGDTTVGHATTYSRIMESLTSCRVPARAQVIRGIAQELERIANHIGDLGALAGDIGFLPTQSYCGRIRGDVLNLTAVLCGNRFGRGLIRPGGVGMDLDAPTAGQMGERAAAIGRDATSAVELLWSTPSVMSRFEGTGALTADLAERMGLVGVAARACGLERDVRNMHPYSIYRFVQIPISTWESGDVFARAFVRWMEVQRSLAFVSEQLKTLPDGPVRETPGPVRPNQFVAALVEGWRGEICHVAATDAQGRFLQYKVVDPSFHNWFGLAYALRDEQISDFPLCNKSFNLSYCGHDL